MPLSDAELEALHARLFKQIVKEMQVHAHVPWWKRGIGWFFDHAFWAGFERVFGIVLGIIIGAIGTHPLLTYDIAAHWLKQHLP
jgi:hypothetical protein